jgi:streptogramin lyase
MADSAGDPVVGATLAGYRIERRLGRGGMSVVYLAEDLALGRKVALKVLAPELSDHPRFRERFRLESRLAASIDHPNVIPLYEAGEAEGQLYIAMRLVDGTDLRRLIDEEGALEPTRAVDLIARVADGLHAAHERGLVHRDVKPSNVLLAGPGEQEHVYLADFGLTKTAESEEEAREAAQLSGTTDYLAPELIIEGAVGTAADVYALGCVLYEALTGQVPYPRSSELETLVAHVDEPTPKPSAVRAELSNSLDAVVGQAMAKDPGERYGSAAELAAAARATLPSAGRSRRLALLLAAVAAILAGAALATVLLTRDGDTGSTALPTTDLASGAVQRVDPETGKLDATIHIQGEPLDLAVSSGAVWLADSDRWLIHRIDPKTNEAEASGPGVHPILGLGSLATASNSLWLAAYGGDGEGLVIPLTSDSAKAQASPVDLRALALQSADPPPPVHAVAQLVPQARTPSIGTFTGWVLDAAEGSLRELRAGNPPILSSPLDLGAEPLVAAADGGNLWVGQEGALVKVVGDKVVQRTPLPGRPVALAIGTDGVWVATNEGALLRRERDGTVSRILQTKGRPVDLELADGAVWLLHVDGTLAKIDPATEQTVTTERVGANAVALAVGEGSVWVAVRGGRQLQRSALPAILVPTDRFSINVPDSDCALNTLEIDCRIGLGFAMMTRGGVRASYHGAWREDRKRGREGVCQGKTFRGRLTASSDVRRDAGAGLVWIERWGTLALRWKRMVVIAEELPGGVAGGPVCGEGSGTWIAIAGPLKGERGEFRFPGSVSESFALR